MTRGDAFCTNFSHITKNPLPIARTRTRVRTYTKMFPKRVTRVTLIVIFFIDNRLRGDAFIFKRVIMRHQCVTITGILARRWRFLIDFGRFGNFTFFCYLKRQTRPVPRVLFPRRGGILAPEASCRTLFETPRARR